MPNEAEPIRKTAEPATGLQGFSDAITALAASVHDCASDNFRTNALTILGRNVAFDSAIWGSAAIGGLTGRPGFAFREVTLWNLVDTAFADAQTAAAVDPQLLAVLGNPGTSIAYSIGPDAPEQLRALTAEHQIGHIMSTASFDPALGIATGLVLFRSPAAAPFESSATAYAQAMFPHLMRCWTENQIESLTRSMLASDGTPRRAAVSRAGLVSAAEGEFIALVRIEWPGWSGPQPPAAITALLAEPDASTYVGEHIVLKVRHALDVSLLLARERVAADSLSPREREVATLCAGGHSYREIASHLGIAPTTARNHIAAVHRRLGVSRNSEISAALATAA
jgi:DNA-binding CsgD family transcriptional regulator